jgi:magnesium transporter
VSNRLNVIMKQLTIISTVFLPLTYLTGFFGQNFAWLVGAISSVPAFLIFGIGVEALAVVGLLMWFWKRGWLTSDAAAAPQPQPNSASRRPRKLRLAHKV